MSNVVAYTQNVDPWRRAIENQSLPYGYTMDEGGTYYKDPNDKDAKLFTVCGAVVVRARVRDPDHNLFGRIIEYRAPDDWVMHRFVNDELLHDTARNLAKALASGGLWINTGNAAHNLLQRLLNGIDCEMAVYTRQCGWSKNTTDREVFVLPCGEVIGGEGVILRPDCALANSRAGTVQEWQDNVAKYAVGNSRLILAITLPLAAPLLRDSGMISGGMHLVGPSQIAKTTVLIAGVSAMGKPANPPDGLLASWSNTSNAMEGVAARANDCALMMDEMSQAQPNDVARIVYSLGNGAGKGRMRADASMRSTYNWRVMVLSTGEERAEDKLAQANRRITAGVDVRLANVPADAGKGHGVFETLHGFADFNALARHLCTMSRQYYGTPLAEFIKNYLELRDGETTRSLNMQCDQWVKDHVMQLASGQVKSVARRFALCAVAGEMAIAMGILPWPAGEASRGIKACLDAWLDDRGDLGMSEDAQIINELRGYLSANMTSAFARSIHDPDYQRQKIVGIRVGGKNGLGEDFMVFRDLFKTLLPERNPKAALKILDKAGLLIRERPNVYWTRKMDNGTAYQFYRISYKIFEYGDE